jgi:hypothetical protein
MDVSYKQWRGCSPQLRKSYGVQNAYNLVANWGAEKAVEYFSTNMRAILTPRLHLLYFIQHKMDYNVSNNGELYLSPSRYFPEAIMPNQNMKVVFLPSSFQPEAYHNFPVSYKTENPYQNRMEMHDHSLQGSFRQILPEVQYQTPQIAYDCFQPPRQSLPTSHRSQSASDIPFQDPGHTNFSVLGSPDRMDRSDIFLADDEMLLNAQQTAENFDIDMASLFGDGAGDPVADSTMPSFLKTKSDTVCSSCGAHSNIKMQATYLLASQYSLIIIAQWTNLPPHRNGPGTRWSE